MTTEDQLDLTPFFDAESVAVIGASDDPDKVGGRVLHYLLRYQYAGRIFPINPRRTEVMGVPAVASLEETPECPELAIVAVPVAAVSDAIEACGRRGVKAAIVLASGYAEIGGDGVRLQQELARTAAANGVRVLGPNCVGAVGARRGLTASMMTGLDQDRFTLRDDGISFVSQSGAIGAFIFNMAQSHGIGLGRFLSTGNEVDISTGRAVEALAADPTTSAVLGYVEGVRDPEQFRSALATAQERGVPLCFMKVGRSERGASAAASHTGSLAGEDAVYDGLFAQYGVARANDIEALLDFGRMTATTPPRGRGATILTLSGGAGILMVDEAEQCGVELPRWSGEWADRMAALLPAFASTANPIDTTGVIATRPEMLRDMFVLCDEHPDTDVTVLLLGNMDRVEEDVCARLVEYTKDLDTPLVVVWVGGSGRPLSLLARAGIPAYSEPVRAVRAISQWMDFAEHQRTFRAGTTQAAPAIPAEARERVAAALAAGRTALDEEEGKALMALAGVPVVRELVADGPDDAWRNAEELGLPVVVKLLADSVAHKSELGGVRVGLGSEREVREAAGEILAAAAEHGVPGARLTVQPQVLGDTELILGMRHDDVFGPVIALGIGGVLTEVLKDVQVRLGPLSRADVHDMIDRLRYRELLEGVRGRAVADRERLVDTVVAFATLADDLGEFVHSMEINPLIVDRDGGLVAVDALVELKSD